MNSGRGRFRETMKVLLLENIDQIASQRFEDSGYVFTSMKGTLKEEELVQALQDIHVLCIRSKTKVSVEVLKQATQLLVIGCFGVGTNQVPIDEAAQLGIPVFNAPHSSTRSVAELTIAEVIMLARRAVDASCQMHHGHWKKSAEGAKEVREKTIGIMGYGHIGQQVGLLAESVGLHVLFYDPMKKLPLGRAKQVESLDELLRAADFLTLHVPGINKVLIADRELSLMKKGSYLLNFSRGNTIDLSALRERILSKHIAGAAVDVYPNEPKTNDEPFHSELAGLENVILTPHIGGSTEEAQYKIAVEVSSAIIQFIDSGGTIGAVNFPQVSLPPFPDSHRILNIHQNIPGVLRDMNKIVSDLGANIDAQHLSTHKNIGYLIMDVNKELSDEVKAQISELSSNIKTRILY